MEKDTHKNLCTAASFLGYLITVAEFSSFSCHHLRKCGPSRYC